MCVGDLSLDAVWMMRTSRVFVHILILFFAGFILLYMFWARAVGKDHSSSGGMSDKTLDYFVTRGLIPRRDAAEVSWSHAVNSRKSLAETLTGSAHMIEADVVIRGREPREPIMAHPPDTDSDITLREWLQSVKDHDNKGIKLDFKSLEALSPSLLLLHELLVPGRPVWINADILPGPGGWSQPLDARSFISAVSVLQSDTVLSLGWTTGWKTGENPGYSWEMVHQMEELCRNLQHDITFAVRAALLSSSTRQLTWLLQQSDRFSLTVWTGKSDEFQLEDLLSFRKQFNVSRIYYDLPQSWRTRLCSAPEDRSPDSVRPEEKQRT